MSWKISYKPDCQENNPKVDSLCKLLFLRYLRWSKIQGTYFKISALYFKIYGLCFFAISHVFFTMSGTEQKILFVSTGFTRCVCVL